MVPGAKIGVRTNVFQLRSSQRSAFPSPSEPTVRGRGFCGQQVAGESHYFDALRKLSGRENTGERDVIAVLGREPNNRHDPNAVRVTIDGRVVGYLPREDAKTYQIPLRILEDQRRPAVCRARLWWSRERDTFIASVSLDLADPASLVPVNSVDMRAGLLIPAGRTYQLTRENERMDVLTPLMRRAYMPGKVAFYATLHAVDRPGPRSTNHIVVVHIDGLEIGELSKQSSAKLVPLLQPMESAGVVCYAEAVLTGNALAVEAKVCVTPPEELAPEFLTRFHQAVHR